MKCSLWCVFMLLAVCSYSQETSHAVRVTGVVIDADDRQTIPYVNISIAGTLYGTSADNNGYFNLFINPGDTLVFSSIGYSDAVFIMPFDVTSTQYSLVQLMRKETLLLSEVVVFPWPTLEKFEEAFLDVEPERGMDDLIREVKRDLKNTVEKTEKSEYYYDQMRYHKLYELHQDIPPNNFLNPFRWSNFIRDLQEGEFREDSE